jgi:hypothetical protein
VLALLFASVRLAYVRDQVTGVFSIRKPEPLTGAECRRDVGRVDVESIETDGEKEMRIGRVRIDVTPGEVPLLPEVLGGLAMRLRTL